MTDEFALETSAVMCTFNGRPFVRAQLISMVEQSPTLGEIVIADDGSSDGTLDVVYRTLEELSRARDLPDVRVLANRASRLGVTRNFERAMSEARGKVVLLADQDDIWRAGRVEAALRAMQEHPGVTLVAHDATLIDADGAPMGGSTFSSMGVSKAKLEVANSPRAISELCRGNFLAGMTFAVDRTLIRDALPIPDGWWHDYWLAIWAALRGQLHVIADPSFLCYRQHDRNVVGVRSKRIVCRARRLMATGSDAVAQRDRYESLYSRLSVTDNRVASATVRHVEEKLRYERSRAALPRSIFKRVPPVVRLAKSGGYKTFAWSGNWSVLRDILYAPGSGDSRHG
jgi:glycosyltransferase involved in cell wall biosynthesis